MFCLLGFLMIYGTCYGSLGRDHAKKKFDRVVVPDSITDQGERSGYVVLHYWDNYDFADTRHALSEEEMEKVFAHYINLMQEVAPSVADSSIRGMMSKAATDSLTFVSLANLYERYLYDEDSPTRNETLYVSALESVLSAPVLGELDKTRPAYLLDLILKNREGEPATDFTYTLEDGTTHTLYNTEADQLLLFFYNPDCVTCREVLGMLKLSSLASKGQDGKEVKVLAVYPYEDVDIWRGYIPEVPKEWINAYDRDVVIFNYELYDLKTLPRLYLLDKDKKVVLKDVTYDELMEFLQGKSE